MEVSKPWVLAKELSTKLKLNEVLYNLAESIRIISAFILPFMPNVAHEIQKQLGLSSENVSVKNRIIWGGVLPGTRVCKGAPVFPRVENSTVS